MGCHYRESETQRLHASAHEEKSIDAHAQGEDQQSVADELEGFNSDDEQGVLRSQVSSLTPNLCFHTIWYFHQQYVHELFSQFKFEASCTGF